jgi:hypothetical protein
MNVDEARQLIKEVMEAKFTDKTFRHYINESLAGDFAVEIATALQNNACQITALKQVVVERETERDRYKAALEVAKDGIGRLRKGDLRPYLGPVYQTVLDEIQAAEAVRG